MLNDKFEVVNEATLTVNSDGVGQLALEANDTTIVDGDKLGIITFSAPSEASGTDAILVGGSIWAEADDTFSASNNDTDIVFATGSTAAAAEVMRLDSSGQLGINCTDAGSLLDVRGDAGAAGIATLSTAELTVVDGDKLGRLDFQAPLTTAGTDSILVSASIWAEANATFSASVNTTDIVFAVGKSEAAAEKMRLSADGNLGIGVSAFGTSGTNVIGITADGTVPSSSPAGMVQIFADDSSGGSANATLAIRTEETVATEVLAGDSSLNIWVNGTEYHWILRAV